MLRNQGVAERLRLLGLKFAEIPLFVNPLEQDWLFLRQPCCFCGTYATARSGDDYLKNQRLSRHCRSFVQHRAQQYADVRYVDFYRIARF